MTSIIDIPNKKSKSFIPHIMLLVGGSMLFFEGFIFIIGGCFILFLGLFLTFSTTGYSINLDEKIYRQYIKFTVFNMGKWMPLPDVDYVALVRVRMSQLKFRPSEVSFGQNTDSYDIAYEVNLIFKNSPQRYKKIFNGNLIEAKEKTILLAKALNLKIYDCSTSQKKWAEASVF